MEGKQIRITESCCLIQPATKHLLPPTSSRTELDVLTDLHEGLTRSPKAQQTRDKTPSTWSIQNTSWSYWLSRVASC